MQASGAKPLISIIVVTWNARRYVDECLASLQSCRLDAEIIVVDNASSDGTVELIREKYPEVCLVENSENAGFARGNNTGMLHSRGKYLFLINSDVNVHPGCIESLVSYMEEHRDIGMIGPQMRSPQEEVRRSSMRRPTLWNMFCRAVALDSLFRGSRWTGGFLMPDFGHDYTRDVEVLNGWFWGVRREAVEQVGLLDERFFMYGEDIDWSYRFRQAGWRVVFYADASAIHYGGASSAAAPVRFYIEMRRANLQYWKKHHGQPSYALYYVIAILHELVRFLGYSLAYPGKASAREESLKKIERSAALLQWLAGSGASSRHAKSPHPLTEPRLP